MRRALPALAGLFLLGSVAPASAQEGYEPSRENLEARAWFQHARFGLFVHWGVYSVPGRGEWVMHNEKYPHRGVREAPAPLQSDRLRSPRPGWPWRKRQA